MGKTKCQKRTTRQRKLENLFHRSCKCVIHDAVYDDDVKVQLYRTCGKAVKKRYVQWLIDSGHLTVKNKWVCSQCVNYAKTNCSSVSGGFSCLTDESEKLETEMDSSQTADVSSEKDNVTEMVENVIKLINDDCVNKGLLSKLSYAIGSALSDTIYRDTKELLSTYKDIDTLSDLDEREFLSKRPNCLIDFISGMTRVNIDAGTKKLLPLCLAVEQMYFLRNHNFIGPFSFANNLVKWTLTGSKGAVKLDGATTASGGITSLKKFIEDSSNTPNTCFENDIDVFADNTQRICRTGKIRVGGTTPVDVATNVVFLQSNPQSAIQNNADYVPEKWLPDVHNVTPSQLQAVNEYEEHLNVNVFRPYRYLYQAELFNKVKDECKHGVDHVQKKLTRPDDVFICSECFGEYGNVNLSCPNCGYNASVLRDRSFLYRNVENQHPHSKPLVRMGEIIGTNPNSRDTIKYVLKDLQMQCNLGKSRKWVRIGFDGVPYNISIDLQNRWLVCNVCGEEVDVKKSNFELHAAQCHPGVDNVENHKLFGNILFVPGSGHMEINMLRSFFSLCRIFCLEHAASCLGFKTKRAKEYISNGVNHHLTWQILNIVFDAFALELLWVFHQECENNPEDVNVHDFVKWKNEKVQSATYLFVYDLVFNSYTGFRCMRSGMRKNNSECLLAGRQKIAPLVYIGKHPIYQNIIFNDMLVRCSAPQQVSEYIAQNESFSVSGDPTKGEGGDYVTEAENRSLKNHLPPGKPTLKSWQQSSRCHEKLKLIREKVFCRACINDPGKEDTSTFKHDLEVQMYRAEIRKSGILKNPTKETPLRSITGELLHPELLNYHYTGQSNYNKYKELQKNAEFNPVFCTFDEEEVYNDIKNWTLNKIKKEIFSLIDQLNTETSVLFSNIFRNQIKRQRKEVHISFLEELKKAHYLCTSEESGVTMSDNPNN